MKSGRTHLMDAVPVTLGQEFGYAAQIREGGARVDATLERLAKIPLGGTATGPPEHPPGGRAAERDLGQPLQGGRRRARRPRGLGRVATKLLAERDRDGLSMGAARLHDVANSSALRQARRPAESSAGWRSLDDHGRAPPRWTAEGKTSFDDWPMFT